MNNLIELRDKIRKLYNETDADLPWVDLIGEAFEKLNKAVILYDDFDEAEHNKNLREGEMEDAGVEDWKESRDE